jgi:hypothetical protein
VENKDVVAEEGAVLEHGRLHVGKMRFWFLALPCQATGLVILFWLVIANAGAALHDGRFVAIDAADKFFIATTDHAIQAASILGDARTRVLAPLIKYDSRTNELELAVVFSR